MVSQSRRPWLEFSLPQKSQVLHQVQQSCNLLGPVHGGLHDLKGFLFKHCWIIPVGLDYERPEIESTDGSLATALLLDLLSMLIGMMANPFLLLKHEQNLLSVSTWWQWWQLLDQYVLLCWSTRLAVICVSSSYHLSAKVSTLNIQLWYQGLLKSLLDWLNFLHISLIHDGVLTSLRSGNTTLSLFTLVNILFYSNGNNK